MGRNSFFAIIVLSLVVLGCQMGPKARGVDSFFSEQQPDSVYRPRYATGFSISYFDGLKLIEIKDPWDSAAVGSRFLVGASAKIQHHSANPLPSVSLPVSSWSCFSSTEVVFGDKLGVLESLRSVAEPQYISHPVIQQGIKGGKIRDVGLASAPDMEVLLESAPEVIFVSPFMDNRYGKLTDAGLLVVPDAGYLEQSPLGRAEWVVLFGAFFDKESVALEIFKDIEQCYVQVRDQAQMVKVKPSVITGTLYQDVWYLPSGDSFMAQLFGDAGTHYPYRDVPGIGSQALDFEKVFNDTWQSDFWVITVNFPGDFKSSDFLEMDRRYVDFKAFKEGHVLFTNSAYSHFFEKGVLEPHVILKDFAALMHPGLFPDYEPVYFNFLR